MPLLPWRRRRAAPPGVSARILRRDEGDPFDSPRRALVRVLRTYRAELSKRRRAWELLERLLYGDPDAQIPGLGALASSDGLDPPDVFDAIEIHAIAADARDALDCGFRSLEELADVADTVGNPALAGVLRDPAAAERTRAALDAAMVEALRAGTPVLTGLAARLVRAPEATDPEPDPAPPA